MGDLNFTCDYCGNKSMGFPYCGTNVPTPKLGKVGVFVIFVVGESYHSHLLDLCKTCGMEMLETAGEKE